MGRPDKETVLKWYKSFLNVLKENDVDINNPGDLSRVKIQYMNEKIPAPRDGFGDNREGLYRHAFIPIKLGQEKKEYQVSEPIPGAREQEDLGNKYDKMIAAMGKTSAKRGELMGAYDNLASEQEVENLNSQIDEAKKLEAKAEKDFFMLSNQIMESHNKWMLGNQKLYDEEADYEQIEELFNMSKEGLLFLRSLNGSAYNKSQILADIEGNAVMGFESEDKKNLEKGPIYSPEDIVVMAELEKDNFAELEKKYGKINLPKAFTKRLPKEPRPVPKPGVLSWFKWVFSFGRVRDDYDRYNAYQNQKREYDENVASYNQEKADTVAYNEKCQEKILGILDDLNAKFYPENIENPGKLGTNLNHVGLLQQAPPAENPEKGIFDDRLGAVIPFYEAQLRYELHGHMELFNEDYSRNFEKSEEYLNTRKKVFAEDDLLEQAKFENKLNIKKEKWLQEKQFAKNVSWVKNGFDEMMEKIGQLNGHSKETGRKMFAACFLQNQMLEPNGAPKESNMIKSNAEVFNEVSKLLEVASKPELLNSPEYKEIVDRCDMLSEGLQFDDMIMDSIAACLTDEENQAKLVDHTIPVNTVAFGAMLMVNTNEKTEKNNSEIASHAANLDDADNMKLADKEAVDKVIDMAKKCTAIKQKFAPKAMNKEKAIENENIKKDMKIAEPEAVNAVHDTAINFHG